MVADASLHTTSPGVVTSREKKTQNPVNILTGSVRCSTCTSLRGDVSLLSLSSRVIYVAMFWSMTDVSGPDDTNSPAGFTGLSCNLAEEGKKEGKKRR